MVGNRDFPENNPPKEAEFSLVPGAHGQVERVYKRGDNDVPDRWTEDSLVKWRILPNHSPDKSAVWIELDQDISRPYVGKSGPDHGKEVKILRLDPQAQGNIRGNPILTEKLTASDRDQGFQDARHFHPIKSALSEADHGVSWVLDGFHFNGNNFTPDSWDPSKNMPSEQKRLSNYNGDSDYLTQSSLEAALLDRGAVLSDYRTEKGESVPAWRTYDMDHNGALGRYENYAQGKLTDETTYYPGVLDKKGGEVLHPSGHTYYQDMGVEASHPDPVKAAAHQAGSGARVTGVTGGDHTDAPHGLATIAGKQPVKKVQGLSGDGR
jgi:hypothetical protein